MVRQAGRKVKGSRSEAVPCIGWRAIALTTASMNRLWTLLLTRDSRHGGRESLCLQLPSSSRAAKAHARRCKHHRESNATVQYRSGDTLRSHINPRHLQPATPDSSSSPPLSLPNGLMNATTLERESPSVCPSVLLAYTVGFTFSFLSTSLTQHSLPVKPCDRFTAAQSSPPAPGETASTHGSTRASGPGSTAAGSESVRVVVFVSCPTTTTTAPPISRGWRWLAGCLPAGQSLNQSVRSVE